MSTNQTEIKQFTLTEVNDWEGETFGYVLNLTSEEASAIQKYVKRIVEEDEELQLNFEETTYSETEIKVINKASDNGYMSRLQHCTLEPDLISKLPEYDYSDFPYKRNGMQRI